MLYVNDELVKKGSLQFDRFQKFKKEVLPKLPNPVIFKSGRPITFNDTGLPEPLPAAWIPLDHNVEGEEGGEHWRYCERPPRKRADGNFIYNPRGLIMKRTWVWTHERDAERIFFFHEISPFVKNGKIVCENKERDAQNVLAKETADLDVRWMITSDHSPISVVQTGKETTLRMMAAAWGVADAHTDALSIAEIKVALLSAVQESHKNYPATQRGYGEFLEEVNEQQRVSTMANVQKAVDTKVLVYDVPTFTWRFSSTNTPLATIPARDAVDPKAALNKFLSLNEKSAKTLGLALGEGYVSEDDDQSDTQDDTGVTAGQVKEMTYNELRRFAKDNLGISIHGMKQDDAAERVITELGVA